MDFFKDIILHAIAKNIGQIILSVDRNPYFRTGKELVKTDFLPTSIDLLEKFIQSVLSNKQIKILKEEMSFVTLFSLQNYRIKTTITYDKGGITINLFPLADEFDFVITGENLSLLEKYITQKKGLFIIAGDKSSGKTSLIYNIIKKLTEEKSYYITSLENPIERRLEIKKGFLQQREIGKHAVSYKEGLLDSVKADADLIFVSGGFSEIPLKEVLSASENLPVFVELQGNTIKAVLNSFLLSMSVPFNFSERCRYLSDHLTCFYYCRKEAGKFLFEMTEIDEYFKRQIAEGSLELKKAVPAVQSEPVNYREKFDEKPFVPKRKEFVPKENPVQSEVKKEKPLSEILKEETGEEHLELEDLIGGILKNPLKPVKE